jgi:hypothetical protein
MMLVKSSIVVAVGSIQHSMLSLLSRLIYVHLYLAHTPHGSSNAREQAIHASARTSCASKVDILYHRIKCPGHQVLRRGLYSFVGIIGQPRHERRQVCESGMKAEPEWP